MSRTTRTVLIYLAVIFLVVMAVSTFLNQSDAPAELTLNEFESALALGEVDSPVEMKEKDNEITGTRNNTQDEFVLRYPGESEADLTQAILDANVDVDVVNENPSLLAWFIGNVFPYLLLFGLFIFLMYQLQGGGNKVMQFGKSKAKLVTKDSPKVTFDDVAGIDEAVEELEELKEFLEQPQKFRAMGAKIPKGVLLYGPPGTGKTLLARAVAGEAGVPFYAISGSEFVEMFVGVGASRVRDLFEQAKANAPSIVFIDEIDAVGRHRGAGLGGGHDEREQTLNQLLVELDGFDPNSGVIVIASTNRPDILDPALVRPGRFDRQVMLDKPDIRGREAILNVHIKGKPLEDYVKLLVLAKQTPGFSGADIANLINEAAILAARRNKKKISMNELNDSVDRVIAGPERKSRVISPKEKEIIAFHETGHALVGWLLPNADRPYKMSIVARGMAGGFTRYLPDEDRHLMTRTQFQAMLAAMMGGHVAEELILGEMTTGPQDDIEKATRIARQMVTQWGMSERLGPRTFGRKEEMVFLGREISEQRNYSEKVAEEIDEEVRHIIDKAYHTAKQVLTDNRDKMNEVAQHLLEKETIEGDDLTSLLAAPVGQTPKPSTGGGAPDEPDQPKEEPKPAEEPETPNPQVGKPGLAYGGQTTIKLDPTVETDAD